MIRSLMCVLNPSATLQTFHIGKNQQILWVLRGKFISSTLNDRQNAAQSWFLDLHKCQVGLVGKTSIITHFFSIMASAQMNLPKTFYSECL